MSTVVILNLRSSGTKRNLERIPNVLATQGVDFERLWKADGTDDLLRLVKRAHKEKVQRLIVGGGDGTMTQVANVVAHSKTILGVLPLGTGNSFALTLGIEPDLEKAVSVIAHGRAELVDLGVVNKRYFVNFATIGFAADVAESTNHDLKKVVGPLAYLVAAARPLLKHRGFRARIRWKGEKLRIETQQLIVVNGRFFGKRPIAPNATDTNGRLTLFTAEGASRAEIVKTYLAFALGLQERLPEGHLLSSKRFVIRTRPKQPLNVDGDALGRTPARFSVARGALRVFVSPDFVDQGK
ncbi:MAG TPA: YegS/Rv2252/BmrU family lipid kinase [Candidatus Baltobacteraceae bacterium]|nr:YegS/Rv2252/BmrU family lipid kinase [Candidatus Baltobacteraceae bacterium]